MYHDDSSRVTWATCPVCGGQLAIGWARRGDQTREVPVEFDCVRHCELTVGQGVRAATEPDTTGALPRPVNDGN